ncbi:hypothetical protein BUALT_Bualt07G0071500 [Buddleja alternifolia]|uniref:Uncharacterized protein n=1 Tax=Buddleja alternifolia TaxID=168488 RepID=A0AAV6X8Q4_9LAMI|nr:hypothetical protein BUALT_Bualt07G0071500 [Buddleja alternifolia]
MPTVAVHRSSLAADPTTEIGSATTPQKRRLRSNSNSSTSSPLRKSPRLCSEGSPISPLKDNVIEKCMKSSMVLCKLQLEKRLSETCLEKPTWDPKGKFIYMKMTLY